MTLFNIWHYLVILVFILILIGGIRISLRQEKKKMIYSMLFSVTLVTTVIGVFFLFIVDKYTKEVELHKLKNKRLLSSEKIIYSGMVKNTGGYAIGEVTFKIKLVSRGSISGKAKTGVFYKSSGFFDMFSNTPSGSKGSNTMTKEFVVAKNLKPGQAKMFRVYFDFPANFRNVSEYAKVYGH
ncbi:MAG: DUF2393 family protein [Campylobacterota bacterium]|nr:DUF2393 family protein [Campylobacterota bacterium]